MLFIIELLSTRARLTPIRVQRAPRLFGPLGSSPQRATKCASKPAKLEYELRIVLRLPGRQEGLGISCRRPTTIIGIGSLSWAAERQVSNLSRVSAIGSASAGLPISR